MFFGVDAYCEEAEQENCSAGAEEGHCRVVVDDGMNVVEALRCTVVMCRSSDRWEAEERLGETTS